jgi:hypothetical protein
MNNPAVEHYANFGTGEPWVARLMLGLKDLVYALPAFGDTREAWSNEMGEVFESLGFAFEDLRTLREQSAVETPALELGRTYSSFYGHLWQAYKDRFQSAMKALGLDVGFLFQNDATFERRAAALVAERPKLSDLIDLMRRDRTDFQNALARYRNDILEHRVAAPDPRLPAAFFRLDSAERMFENVWQAMEDYVVLYVIAHLPAALRIVEIPEEQREPARPTRFGIEIVKAGRHR